MWGGGAGSGAGGAGSGAYVAGSVAGGGAYTAGSAEAGGAASAGGMGGAGAHGASYGGAGANGAHYVGGAGVQSVTVLSGGGIAGPDVDGCTTGCAAAGCAQLGPATMTFVGTGQGDYVTETTYRFVGQGAGNLAVFAPRNMLWGRIACVALMFLAGATIVMALAIPPGTTTPEPEVQQAGFEEEVEPTGECTFWGDPHLRTFDGAHPSFYGEGELYIVKSDSVIIQGRYQGTKYTSGLAATRKIVVGGPFVNNHRIEVGAMEDGPITVDETPVLTTFPSTYRLEGLGFITYTTEGKLVDAAGTNQFERHIVQMELPNGVHIEVLRWANYVDLRIVMQRQPGQDGGCGNWNNDPTDDNTEAVFERIGARVPEGELMFRTRAPVDMTSVEDQLLSACSEETLRTAKRECPTELQSSIANPSDVELRSCLLDHCYGSNEHTLRLAKEWGLVQE